MKLENSREKGMVAALLLLLLIHLAVTFFAQSGNYQKKQQQAAENIATFDLSTTELALAQLSALSELFGIQPSLAVAGDANNEAEQDLLQVKPTLLAVSESAGQFTAKIAVSEQNKNRIVTMRPGDELLGYKLTKLTLNDAEFSNGVSSFTMHMFKRDDSTKTK